MACRKEEYAQVLQNTHGAKITSWWDRAVDIIPVSGGKGTGIAKMLEYYGIDRSRAMAFGDGNNDIKMFQAVDMGIAHGECIRRPENSGSRYLWLCG